MSVAVKPAKSGFLSKEISFGRKPKAQQSAPSVAVDAVASAASQSASKRTAGAQLETGLAPRANLMPPELVANRRALSTRRQLRFGLVVVLVLVVLGVGASFVYAQQAQQALQSAQADTAALNAKLGGYKDLLAAQKEITVGQSAVEVGGSTDIDWAAYIGKLQSTLPSGVQLTGITADSMGIEKPYTQSIVPLEQSRIGTLTFTAKTTQAPSIPDWIDRLSALPGFADATPQSVSYDGNAYTATVMMHINKDAFSNVYAKADKK